MAADVTLRFLRDTRHGGPPGQSGQVAATLAAFIGAAKHSLDMAIYDFRLSGALAEVVVNAFIAAAERGVTVRIAYDAGKPQVATAATFARIQADPAPPGTAEWVHAHFANSAVDTRPIDPGSHLMHSKYLIRDAGHAAATVWTGSANFTDDAWRLQENNIVRLRSPAIAAAFTADFEQMWQTGTITATGKGLGGTAVVGGSAVAWDFAPGDGQAIDAALTAMVAGAQQRIVLATMVLTSHTVLAALVAAVGRGIPVTGIYDSGQMDPIVRQWRRSKAAGTAQALADFLQVAALLAKKQSTPYTPTSDHDFLHHKVVVCDSVVATGSYNFSANAEHNAENHLRISSPSIADRYVAQIRALMKAYG